MSGSGYESGWLLVVFNEFDDFSFNKTNGMQKCKDWFQTRFVTDAEDRIVSVNKNTFHLYILA